MKKNISVIMKESAGIFRKKALSKHGAASGWLTDNYYILEGTARRAADESKRILKTVKGSELFPGLFDACLNLCRRGVLPDENGIISGLSDSVRSAGACEYLSLALNCALILEGAKGASMGGEEGEKLLSGAVKSLRRAGELDFERLYAALDPCEKYLNADPAGIYPIMDKATKAAYRNSVASLAKKRGIDEESFVRKALEKCDKTEHIGKYVYAVPSRRKRGIFFLIFETLFPAACAAALGILLNSLPVALLSFLPLRELFANQITAASMRGVKPVKLPSLDPEKVGGRSEILITVSMLMPSPDKAEKMGEHLEKLYLGNKGKGIKVCCLADLKSASKPVLPGDKAACEAMKRVVGELNLRHGGGFVLAVRPRAYSETQREFTGRERKRGAITALVRAINGNSSEFSTLYGDLSTLERVDYLAVLDSDTIPEFDGIKALAAVAEHPLNKPLADTKKGRVVSGFGIITPLCVNGISEKKRTFFARFTAGETGLSSYSQGASERYADLFGEGIFCGKGLIDTAAYYALLNDSLPDEKILSHDILEGGFLRVGYVPQVQMSDSVPQSPASYFLRLGRWIRGDWQNAGFIFKKNPLNLLSRYKLLQNLRRSVTSSAGLLAVICSAFLSGNVGIALFITGVLSLFLPEALSGLGSLMRNGIASLCTLFYSDVMPAALGSFARALLNTVFSARKSFTELSSAVKALWRTLVSKRNLLEWITAASGEKRSPLAKKLISCLPAVLTSGFLFAFGSPLHYLMGFILLLDIPAGLLGDKVRKTPADVLSDSEREKLYSYTSAAWGFFDELCGRENCFLPPDNIQFAPARSTARRTSPTNIGLMLVSFLSARDLGLISTQQLCVRLRLSLGTVEKLEKYHGNLFNWYSTEDCSPLEPKFVSTVDSGNFLCCLTALKEGLREYAGEYSGMDEIIVRIEKLIDETDLFPLYNSSRELFYTGIDPVTGEKSESCYDLFMSEARMTAYYAVAKRIVPKSHWGAMGRIPVSRGRYRGLVSWTGTMFEYFMPELFIPSPKGSLSYESLNFCLHCQRKRAGKRPFGISESGFYAFDGELNYQYKAHGVQKIGLRRGLDENFVISPYSSFLTLTAAPEASLNNLKRLEKMGLTGKYGFYEAADFGGSAGKGGFSVVSSYMAHHVGMSIAAADNMLNSRCWQRRFMSDGAMKGAESLLREKIPTDARAFRDIKQTETPKIRERVQSMNVLSSEPSPAFPQASVYSNGRMSCFISDCGTGITLFDGIDLNVRDTDIIMRPRGILAVFVTDDGIMPLCSALCRDDNTTFSCGFYRDRAEFTAKSGKIKTKTTVRVLKTVNCEERIFTIENTDKKQPVNGKLMVYFEPCLDYCGNFAAHPAFSKLFITSRYDKSRGCLVFSGRKGNDSGDCAFAAGFESIEGVAFEADRAGVLTTPQDVFSLGQKTGFSMNEGSTDSCCAFSADITVPPGGRFKRRFILAADDTSDGALGVFDTVKNMKYDKKYAENPFRGDRVTEMLSVRLLSAVMYPQKRIRDSDSCAPGQGDLWSLGISGDIPIVSVTLADTDDISRAEPYVRFNRIIRSCGMPTDLALIYHSRDGYIDEFTGGIDNILKKENCILMRGVRGGVHRVNSARCTAEGLSALKALSVFQDDSSEKEVLSENKQFKPLEIVTEYCGENAVKEQDCVKQLNFTSKQISVLQRGKTVDIPWNHILANKNFGTMMSDKAIGFTWAMNSGMNKITPWYNDAMSDNRGERILMRIENKYYDIATVSDAVFTPDKAEWSCEISGLKIRLTVEVADRAMVKRCILKIENLSGEPVEADIVYLAVPVLGESHTRPAALCFRETQGGCIVSNPMAAIKGTAALQCSGGSDCVCFSLKKLLCGGYDSDETDNCRDVMSVIKRTELAAGGKTEKIFYLSWGACESAALNMPYVARFDSPVKSFPPLRSGNENLDLFYNSFLYGQIKQCRFFGRTGFYQCSGAYGFRDQLQDSLAFIGTEPELTRIHLLRCAAVQFIQGDVLHWWHVTVNKTKKISGIRTKCSDDMLWLPFVMCEYVKNTGDMSIIQTEVPYIYSRELEKGERECYLTPEIPEIKENMLCHCMRALEYSFKFGSHGLPLIGSCDWNDGFSLAGNEEEGESVWLAMFQIMVLERMAWLCRECDMQEKAEEYRVIAGKLRDTIERVCWDEDRYIRAFLKNGTVLGRNRDYIDILPQAFAVFAGIGTDGRAEIALNTAYEKLLDEKNGIIRLLSPPFGEYERDGVGYIASYPPGVRENGGQYTHGAVWLAMAFFKTGDIERGVKLLEVINPLNKYDNESTAAAYRGEPYVLAGDVSGNANHPGRAGWTHFTGSAAWFAKCVSDNIDAIRRYYENDTR